MKMKMMKNKIYLRQRKVLVPQLQSIVAYEST